MQYFGQLYTDRLTFLTLDFPPLDIEALEMTETSADEHSLREESEDNSESDNVSTSDSEQHSGGQSFHWRGFMHMLKKGPKRFQPFQPLTLPKLTRRKSRSARNSMIPVIPSLESGMSLFKPSWKNFSLKELHEATNTFNKGKFVMAKPSFPCVNTENVSCEVKKYSDFEI